MKEAREKEHEAYMRSLTPSDIKRENAFRAAQRRAGRSRRSNIKDPNAPKKPLSAYFMFLQQIRANPKLVAEIFGDETETTKQSVLAAAKWRSMTDAERQVGLHFNLLSSLLLDTDNHLRPSHSLLRLSRRRWNMRLHGDCMKRVRLRVALDPPLTSVSWEAHTFPLSRWSPRSRKVRAL